MSLLDIAAQFNKQLPDIKTQSANAWVAFSGGLDSTVLLHLLKAANIPNLRAVHVNHQISTNANAWQAHCAALCQAWEIPFVAEKVIVEQQGFGIEDAARKARYAVFAKVMQKSDWLFTAHHADDQAETLMLRLLRGTGVKGLSGIATNKSFEPGQMFRPLLNMTRDELLNYANQHQLSWIEDESNFSDIFDRNYLRLRVMPLLQKRWPGFQKKWHQTASLMADAGELLSDLAQLDLSQMDRRGERVGESIDLKSLSNLSRPRQQNLLRLWLHQQAYNTPEQQHWQQIYAQIFSDNADVEINVQFGDVSLRVYQTRLYSLPAELPQFQLQQTPRVAQQGECLLRSDLTNLRIKTREGGERCKPATRQHSQTLKKLLQEYKLEPWLRDQIPLIYSDDNLVAVGDLWVCAGYETVVGQEGIELSWKLANQ